MIWIPTATGEVLYHHLADGNDGVPPIQPLRTPAG
jgi:hypothetical protein